MSNQDVIKRSDELDERMTKLPDLNQAVVDLITSGKRLRRLINLIYVVIILEVALSIVGVIIYTGSQVNRANIATLHASLVSSCKANNDFRSDNLKLWQYLLAIPPEQPQTPAQQKITTDFNSFVSKTFAPRNCDTIYP